MRNMERVELHVQNQVGVYESRNAQPGGSLIFGRDEEGEETLCQR